MSGEIDPEKMAKALGYQTFERTAVDGMVSLPIKGFNKFRDSTRRRFERDAAGQPDFDSGFHRVIAGEDPSEFIHRLKAVPTRYTIEISQYQNPVEGQDIIRVIPSLIRLVDAGPPAEYSGVELYYKGRDRAYVQVAGDYIYGSGGTGWTSAYLRLFLWR